MIRKLGVGWAIFAVFFFISHSAHANSCAGGYTTVCAGGCLNTSIKTAAANIPAGALTGDYCIDVRDNGPYNEQITVINKNPNNFQIIIGTDTGGTNPIVHPPANSTAAFQIANASVTIFNVTAAVANPVNYGIWASSGYVTLNSVAVTTTGINGVIAYAGIGISSWSTVSQSSVTVANTNAIELVGSLATIAYSTMTANSPRQALYVSGSSNTITHSLILNPSQKGIYFDLGGNDNAITFSTMSGHDDGVTILSAGNVISDSFMGSIVGSGARIYAGNNNTILRSTMTTTAANANAGLYISDGNFNVIANSYIYNPIGPGAIVDDNISHAGSNENILSMSTMTGVGDSGLAIINSSATVIMNCYVQGFSGIDVWGSTGTIIGGSILVATNTVGSALWISSASKSVSLTTNTFIGGAQGAGLLMDPFNSGLVSLTSNTITHGRWGVYIATMSCGGTCTSANLTISSMIFSGGLTAGATAIHFAGGSFASTFTSVAFYDPNIGSDVNGRPLAQASRITMQSFSGAKAGPAFENDPNNLVDWAAGSPPINPVLSAIWVSSATVSFGSVGANGYVVNASTAANFTGTVLSSASAGQPSALAPQNLFPNTTYFFQSGALWSPTTFYANTTPPTGVTPANLVSNVQFGAVSFATATVSWTPLPSAAQAGSSSTCEGYLLQASTAPNFTGTIFSSATAGSTSASLAVGGLSALTTYYFRVGTLNWASAVSYASSVSTVTPTAAANTPPTSPVVAQVYVSSVAVSYGTVGSLGYDVDASTAINFSGTLFSSATAGQQGMLAPQNLFPNTTYYLRAGALWASTTFYAGASPASTSTLANPVTGSPQFFAVYTASVTVNWPPLPTAAQAGSSSTCEGYVVVASTVADFSGTVYSSGTGGVGQSTLTVGGLADFTTYYFQIGTLNWNGAPNFIFAGAIQTLGIAPGSPAIASMFVTSAAVTFTAVGAGSYVVDASTASDFSGQLFSASGGASPLFPQGLSPNTTYYFRAGANFAGVITYANTAPQSGITQAATPGPLSFTSISLNQFTVNWPANGNPGGTLYEVHIATDIAFSNLAASSFTTVQIATFTSLTALATYYVEVRALNSLGVPSPYVLGAVITANGVISISANRLPGVWYNILSALFFAQGASNYHYKITSTPSVPSITDPVFTGSGLTLGLVQGPNYFNVLGTNASDTVVIGTATFGPVDVDTGAPIMLSIAAQNSASDPTPIFDGGTTLATTPRFTWPAAVSFSPIVGYSFSLSTDAAAVPLGAINTTITFIDKALSASGIYYAKVAAMNLAGSLGAPVSMSFTFTTTPSANRLLLTSNYFNPLRGGCMQIEIDTASGGRIKAIVYDFMGQRISTLADQDVSPGVFVFPWCGRNASNEVVGTGAYLLHVESPGQKKNFKVFSIK